MTDSERPIPPRPRMKDPLWTGFETLSTHVANILPRLTAVELLAKEAHATALEARSKADVLALAQVAAQKDFTLAIQAQTIALTSFGTSLNGVRVLGRWMLGLILVMSLGTFATLIVTLLR